MGHSTLCASISPTTAARLSISRASPTPSYTPFQYVDKNVITNNTLSGNGIDADNPIDDAPTGISVFSAVIPIPNTVIASNRVTDEQYGIVSFNAVKLDGLPSNKLDVPVPTKIQ